MISKQAQQIKSSLIRDSLNDQPIEEKRRAWENHAEQLPIAADVQVSIQLIDGVRCMRHTPDKEHRSDSVILYLHGGGLVEGSVNTSREWCSRLAKAAKQTVVSVDYRLAPEHPYPAAISDVIRVYRELRFGPSSVCISSIGAESTGCILALQLLIRLRDEPGELPASCFLLSPSIDLAFQGKTIDANATADPIVSKDVLKYYASLYAGNHDLASMEISPLYAKLNGLPNILVFVDDSEILFDDTLRLEAAVKSAGGEIQVLIGYGLWHVWPTWADFPEARIATKHIVNHIEKAIDQ